MGICCMDATQHVELPVPRRDRTGAGQPRHGVGISLVLPAYNEEEVIEQAIREADEGLRAVTDDYEILVVDDGSRDLTGERAVRAAQDRPAVRVVRHEVNRGYGAALRTGFQAATKPYVGFTDADCQFHVREIGRLTGLLDDCDIACGYRLNRQDPWYRLLYSRIYNGLVRLLLGTGVRDCDCALKLFRREVLDELPLTTDGFLVNAELLARARMAGKSVIEVGVTHRARPLGRSTVSVLHTIPVLVALLQFWWSVVMFPARETSGGEDRANRWGRALHGGAAALLAACAALLLLGNLTYPLVDPDESRYVQIALEMLQTGDFVVPRLQGEPYLDKPPLLYWVTAGSIWLFGPSELAARLPAALAAILTTLSTYLLGALLVGRRAAFCGAMMLLLSLGFVLSGRFVIMDGPLTLFTTVSLLSLFLAVRGARVRTAWWLVGTVACGLGVLTKGPVALVVTVPPLAGLLGLDRARARVRLRHWFAFALPILAMTAPWFVLTALRQEGFASYFFWRHHVVRFVSEFGHGAPAWFYLPVLLIGMFPSSLLAGPTLDFLMGRRGELRALRTRELGALTLAVVWILIFFSASRCKLPTYVLPAVPLLCLVQGCMLHQLLAGRYARATWARLAQRLPVHAVELAVTIAAGLAVADLVLEPDRGVARVLNYLVLGGALVFLLDRLIRRQASWGAQPVRWCLAAGVLLLLMGFAYQKFVPELAWHRSIGANAARLCRTPDGASMPVVYFAWQSDGSGLYLPAAQVRRFRDSQFASLVQFLLRNRRALLVADPSHAALVRDALGDRVTLTRSRGARGRLYLLSSHSAAERLVDARHGTPPRR